MRTLPWVVGIVVVVLAVAAVVRSVEEPAVATFSTMTLPPPTSETPRPSWSLDRCADESSDMMRNMEMYERWPKM